MKLWAAWASFGLFVVRAEDEASAKRVALDTEDGVGQYDPDLTVDDVEVEELKLDGDEAVLAEHYS